MGIKSRWGTPHLDQMPENPPQLVGILEDGEEVEGVEHVKVLLLDHNDTVRTPTGDTLNVA